MKTKTIQIDQKKNLQFLFSEYPMVRFLIIVILGILTALFSVKIKLELYYILTFVFIISAILIFYFRMQGTYYVLTFLIGFMLLFHSYKPFPESLKGQIFPAYLRGSIVKIEKKTQKNLRCIVEGSIVLVNSKGILSDEQYEITLMCRIIGEPIQSFLSVGSQIESIAQIQFPGKPELPTDFDKEQYILSKGVNSFATISTKNIPVHSENKWYLETELQLWREELEIRIRKWIVPEFVPIVLGLLYGNTSGIDPNDIEILQRFGLIHILSTSGSHIAFITLILWIALFFIRSHLVKSLLVGVLLLIFVLFTGLQIPAIRAAIMAFILFVLPHCNRKSKPINLLAFATIFILLFNPLVLFSLSFYFSTLAILGIYAFYVNISESLERIFDSIKKDFWFKKPIKTILIPTVSISVSASLFLNILSSLFFYKLSVSSLIGNTIFLFLYSLAFFGAVQTIFFSFFLQNFAYYSGITTSFVLDISEKGMVFLDSIFVTEIHGYSVWIVAVSIALGVFYCTNSDSLRKFIYRTICALIFIPIVYGISSRISIDIPTTSKYSVDKSTLLLVNQDSESFQFLLTSKDAILPYTTISIERFFKILPKKVHLYYSNMDTISKTNLALITSVESKKQISEQRQLELYKLFLKTKNLYPNR